MITRVNLLATAAATTGLIIGIGAILRTVRRRFIHRDLGVVSAAWISAHFKNGPDPDR
jgi:hypothetical protein